MGGSSKKTTTTTQKPRHIEQGSRVAASMATRYATTPYQAYEGERVAPLSSNEQRGYNLATESSGQALAALEGAGQRFSEADMQGYMNPYIKGALDPAAREIEQAGARRLNETRGAFASRGAFSGSRAILAEREANELTDQSLSDLYGQGYAEAFERGADRWQQDQDRALRMVGLRSDIISQDIQNLMSTGETARIIEQGKADFNYQQFVEDRDWEGRNAEILTNILGGLRGSYGETTVTREKDSGDMFGEILGAVATVAGAYIMAGSDERLKTNIRKVGELGPLNLYTWEWNDEAERLGLADSEPRGVIAQEVIQHYPQVIRYHSSGYLLVNYGQLYDIHHKASAA